MTTTPGWIDWTDGQGYRKITNVQGGSTLSQPSNHLRWLAWETNGVPQNGGTTYTYTGGGPNNGDTYSNAYVSGNLVWKDNPEIVLGRDIKNGNQVNGKFFIDANQALKTAGGNYVNKNPGVGCATTNDSDTGFCRIYSNHSATTTWQVGMVDPRAGMCSFLDENGVCVNDYQQNFYTFPDESLSNSVPWYVGYQETQANSGSPNGRFCQNVTRQGNYPETLMMISGKYANRGSGIYPCNTLVSGTYPQIATPTGSSQSMVKDTGELSWIDQQGAMNCCSLPVTKRNMDTFAPTYPMCLSAYSNFNPAIDGNYCNEVALDFCSTEWSQTTPPATGTSCSNYLTTSPVAGVTVDKMIRNYVMNPERNPRDYISPQLAANQLAQGNTTSPAVKACYTTDGNGNYTPVTRPDPNNPGQTINTCWNTDAKGNKTYRDDSIDPFFANTTPYTCNTIVQNNNNKVRCDAILDAFCQEFSRDDILGSSANNPNGNSSTWDTTLMNMCGCHLIINPKSGDPNNPANNPLGLSATAQTTSPYYDLAQAELPGCDPICLNAQIQNANLGKCTTPQCIIDDITFNINYSQTGGFNFTQNCTGGNCYIGNIDINADGSSITGSASFQQSCQNCFIMNGNSVNDATPVDCNTLQPIQTNGGGGNNTPSNDGGWWDGLFSNKLVWALVILFLFIIVLVGFAVYLSHHNKKKDIMESGVPKDYYDANLY